MMGSANSVHVRIDEEEFRARCDQGATNAELMSEFGCVYNRVKTLKRKLGTGKQVNNALWQSERMEVITFESLRTRWMCEDAGAGTLHRLTVPIGVKILAGDLSVGVRALRKRMKDVEFEPMHPWTLEEVKTMVRSILEQHTGGQLGATFVEAKLRLPPHGVVVRMSMIRQALLAVDSHNYRRRSRSEKKRPSQYTVKGPRSLYHMDAHEKLAKLWCESNLLCVVIQCWRAREPVVMDQITLCLTVLYGEIIQESGFMVVLMGTVVF